MRIAYLADPRSRNGIYRGIAPMAALQRWRGHRVQRLFNDDAEPRSAELRGVDVLFVHRYCNPHAQQLVSAAKAAGVPVVWDNDDDMGAIPPDAPNARHFGGVAWERRLGQMRKVFGFADLVTTPSEVLSERMRGWGATRTATIENHLPPEFLRTNARPHSGTTIGWVAGLEHGVDADRFGVRSTLQRLLDERPDVNVVTVGLALGLRSDRYRHIPVVALPELTQQIAEFDIAIAPIADIDFNRSRSNIKLKEYAAAGTPWLASPIGPYAGLGEQQGGRLVADDRWYEALRTLIDKPRQRRKLAKRAKRWAEAQTLDECAVVWERHFEETIERARAAA
jgi:glycosyltransferase involved in cell wall biosynthesis